MRASRNLMGLAFLGIILSVLLRHLFNRQACAAAEPYKIGAIFSITGVGSFLVNLKRRPLK